MKRLISLPLSLLLILALVVPAMAHHINTIDITADCQNDAIVLDIDHDIYGKVQLEWFATVNGVEYGATQVPDSRYASTIRLPITTCGDFLVYAKARATDQKVWVETKAIVTCDCPPVEKVKAGNGRILGPCGDPFYAAQAQTFAKSDRPITFSLWRDGERIWKAKAEPGDKVRMAPRWFPGGVRLVLKDGSGKVYDRERTVSGTFPWDACR